MSDRRMTKSEALATKHMWKTNTTSVLFKFDGVQYMRACPNCFEVKGSGIDARCKSCSESTTDIAIRFIKEEVT